MIFVTVGHQMPFDRLIRGVDAWAEANDRHDLFAQIGDGEYQPRHFKSVAHVSPQEFNDHIELATGIVAHAGMGTIITALRLGKPLLVMPRWGRLGETRNDHQVATAQHFAETGRLLVAMDETELANRLAELESFTPPGPIAGTASPELLARLRSFAFDAGGRRNDGG